MKHYILAKFKDKSDTEKLFPEIKKLFERTLTIDGVKDVVVHKSNSSRENRYSLMIEMTMTSEALPVYDLSVPHKEWKALYGDRLESKAIFDCEETE